ncbi:MAG: membrane protein insertase YidC [Candidatus Aminicenantales bacterium]
MEKRLLVAIVLSFLVIFAFQALFMKKAPSPVIPPEEAVQMERKEAQTPLEKEPSSPAVISQKPEPAAEVPGLQQISAQSEERIIIDTSLYQAVWTNRGGLLKSWKLKTHKSAAREDLELIPEYTKELNVFPFLLSEENPDLTQNSVISGIVNNVYNSSFYRSSTRSLNLKDGQKGEIRFEYSDGKEIKVEKIFTFYGGKFNFDIEIILWKNGQKIEPWLLWGPGIDNPSPEEIKQRFGAGGGISVLASNKLFRIEERKYKPEQSAFNFVTWAAYDDNYFAALFLPASQNGIASFLKEDRDNISYFFLSVSNPRQAYIGPKEFDTLVALGHNTKKIVRFGFFGWIAEILLWSIKYIHRIIPNWGFAIIALTLVIKIIFFPLTYSSTKSMAKMQELQPKIKALRAKYKKAKQDIAQRRQMNEEMMKLYKEHGVNPAGGCLPMLIQLPVFWGFFRMLVVAIEFRHSPFIFWIKDLSVKDPFYVTPILMGATQFISQKLTPTSADPSQARLMLIMPVIMTLFFMNFQSGLVLYWLTSNVLQIAQQYVMNRMIKSKKRESHGKRRKNR